MSLTHRINSLLPDVLNTTGRSLYENSDTVT